jgi:hypothetical protein
MLNWKGLEGIYHGEIVVYHGIFLQGLRQNMKKSVRIADVPREIRTKYLQIGVLFLTAY